jgi:hypothetical protein
MGCLQGWDGGRFKSVKSRMTTLVHVVSSSFFFHVGAISFCGKVLANYPPVSLWCIHMDLLFTFYTGVYFLI